MGKLRNARWRAAAVATKPSDRQAVDDLVGDRLTFRTITAGFMVHRNPPSRLIPDLPQ
jgi:hypothetical protein